ncbi:hypothetical protein [Neisseria sp. S1]|uniref:hypothetical protein n=1 Tax=Neisseria sp. S1 TaxID=3318354 RepID=UPI003A85198B
MKHYYDIWSNGRRLIASDYGSIFKMDLIEKGRLKAKIYFSNWARFDSLAKEFLATGRITDNRVFVEVVK